MPFISSPTLNFFSMVRNSEYYELSSEVENIDEGQTLTITLLTEFVSDGKIVPYTITGIDSSDLEQVFNAESPQQDATILTPPSSESNTPRLFGSSVACSSDGNFMVVGSTMNLSTSLVQELGGTQLPGGVYTYQWNSSTEQWEQLGNILFASDATNGDLFGASVSLSMDGSFLVVGANRWDSALSNQGCVYTYQWNSSTNSWDEVVSTNTGNNILIPSDAGGSDEFGFSTKLSGDGSILVVGARNWDAYNTDQGCVYTYQWNSSTNSWDGIVSSNTGNNILIPSDAGGHDEFGYSVSLSVDASVLVVGAYEWDKDTNNDPGAVYTFNWNSSTTSWDQVDVFTVSDDFRSENSTYNFGKSVA